MSTTITVLLCLDQFISRYCLGLLFILGVISITLNTIIFTRRTFRNTSCILYFLASNIANYPVVCFVIPCRFFADGFNLDPTRTNASFCKFREYILTVSRSLAAWFIVLASFDRLMSSSRNVHYRQFCQIRKARRVIILITLFGLLLYLYIPIIFISHAENDQCEAPNDTSRIINDCIYSICYVIIPGFLLLIFGSLTVNNRRQTRHVNIFHRQRNRSLFLMIIFQFILFVCTTTPLAVQKLYTTLTYGEMNTNLYQVVMMNLFIHTARMTSFINHSCQFYIFTWSSKLFRQELRKFFYQLIPIKRNRIRQPPAATITMNNNQIHFQ